MRVTGYDKFQMTQHYLTKIETESVKKQQQIATGKQFSRVSDDPVRVNRSMLMDVTESRLNQYQANANDTKSLLQYMDVAFDSASTALDEAKEIGIKGANGTYSDSDRITLSNSVEEIIKQVVGLANSQHLDRYMFSGEKINAKPIDYDGTAFTYNGNDKDMSVRVSDDVNVKVTQSAEQVFLPALNELIKLRDALKNNDQDGIEAALGGVQAESNNFIDKRAKIGVQTQSVELLNESYSQVKLDLSVKRQENDDVDMTAAISDFSYMQSIYQATIQSSLKMMQNSILDYI
ncbi:flagellar hook-associated protein FlgL [Priestia aryabhattai]|uniref:Flagellar hook-associated protein FlgL n=1 Tax=Priestia aryabhattai TaxID=412384 RepID=A0AAX6NDN4_PRIAR|nr:flagellar hook-associated protein FlgL [Priestia aryabhattai]MDU9693770.1 flagellar hook-associated protein FlgL [Priestia aryabhattai]